MIHPLRKGIIALREAIEFMEPQQRIFFRDTPMLARQLCQAARQHRGRLTVAREISSDRIAAIDSMMSRLSTRSPISRYEEVAIGVLSVIPAQANHVGNLTASTAALRRASDGPEW